jgi:hypothetical protein
MVERDKLLADIHVRLEQAQAIYKHHYDKNHRAVSSVGDWVWLRLCHRALASLQVAVSGKLKHRYYGPYKVVAVVNPVAYKLDCHRRHGCTPAEEV